MTYSRNGGVSKKNTATVNLAYELSQLNKRVLILNFDGQGDTTKNSVNKNKILDPRYIMSSRRDFLGIRTVVTTKRS